MGTAYPPTLLRRRPHSPWVSRGALVRALEQGGLELHLQPILDLRASRVVGAEALVRMHDQHRVLSPAEFLPHAEAEGLLPQVDAWVVRAALGMLSQLLPTVPDFRLSANVSALSLAEPGYRRAVDTAIAAHPFPHGQFILELTETAAVAHVPSADAFFDTLSARGVGLAIDDFGSGYGSFANLKHLGFNYLKIDGDFIEGVTVSPVDQAIVRALVGVAGDLGIQTVAEHVTDQAALETVAELGVDLGQGYGIGAPVPLAEFTQRHLPPLEATA